MKQTEWAEKALKNLPERAKKYSIPILVLLIGMLLLVGGRNKEETPKEQAPPENGFSLAAFEARLQAQLSSVKGAGRVSLMLTLDQTEQSVYAFNVRQSGSGQNTAQYESDVTVVNSEGYGQTPVTVKQILPRFRGALVLCDGAEDTSVRLAITEAVGTACGLGADKVSVLKME